MLQNHPNVGFTVPWVREVLDELVKESFLNALVVPLYDQLSGFRRTRQPELSKNWPACHAVNDQGKQCNPTHETKQLRGVRPGWVAGERFTAELIVECNREGNTNSSTKPSKGCKE